MGWRTVDRTNGIIRLLQFTLRSERVICILVYIYIHMRVCVCMCVCVFIYIYIYVCVDILHCILYIYAIKSQLYICCIHSPNHLVHFRTHGSYHLHEKKSFGNVLAATPHPACYTSAAPTPPARQPWRLWRPRCPTAPAALRREVTRCRGRRQPLATALHQGMAMIGGK